MSGMNLIKERTCTLIDIGMNLSIYFIKGFLNCIFIFFVFLKIVCNKNWLRMIKKRVIFNF